MSEDTRTRPFEPIASATDWLLKLTKFACVLGAVALLPAVSSVIRGDGPEVCADSSTMHRELDPSAGSTRMRVQAGVSVTTSTVDVCTDHPGVGQAVCALLTFLPSFLLFLGFLILLRRLVRTAENSGVHSVQTAHGLARVGWFLLIASAASAAVEGLARSILLSTLVDSDANSGFVPGNWDFPLVPLLAGLGVLAFAQIMRAGVRMREDLEGTV